MKHDLNLFVLTSGRAVVGISWNVLADSQGCVAVVGVS